MARSLPGGLVHGEPHRALFRRPAGRDVRVLPEDRARREVLLVQGEGRGCRRWRRGLLRGIVTDQWSAAAPGEDECLYRDGLRLHVAPLLHPQVASAVRLSSSSSLLLLLLLLLVVSFFLRVDRCCFCCSRVVVLVVLFLIVLLVFDIHIIMIDRISSRFLIL